MQIIKPIPVEKDIARPTELATGTVYTWGCEDYFYMVCQDGLSVCLNDGQTRKTAALNNNLPVRIVKGAFHVED
jgi:hypothetical protein